MPFFPHWDDLETSVVLQFWVGWDHHALVRNTTQLLDPTNVDTTVFDGRSHSTGTAGVGNQISHQGNRIADRLFGDILGRYNEEGFADVFSRYTKGKQPVRMSFQQSRHRSRGRPSGVRGERSSRGRGIARGRRGGSVGNPAGAGGSSGQGGARSGGFMKARTAQTLSCRETSLGRRMISVPEVLPVSDVVLDFSKKGGPSSGAPNEGAGGPTSSSTAHHDILTISASVRRSDTRPRTKARHLARSSQTHESSSSTVQPFPDCGPAITSAGGRIEPQRQQTKDLCSPLLPDEDDFCVTARPSPPAEGHHHPRVTGAYLNSRALRSSSAAPSGGASCSSLTSSQPEGRTRRRTMGHYVLRDGHITCDLQDYVFEAVWIDPDIELAYVYSSYQAAVAHLLISYRIGLQALRLHYLDLIAGSDSFVLSGAASGGSGGGGTPTALTSSKRYHEYQLLIRKWLFLLEIRLSVFRRRGGCWRCGGSM